MYSTALPTLEEAIPLKLVQMIQDGLATIINPVLAGDADTAGIQMTPDQVVWGDPMEIQKTRISIVEDGDQAGANIQTEPIYFPLTDTQGFRETFNTSIYVYIHEDEFPSADPMEQDRIRRKFRAKLVGCLRKRIFNARENVAIQLASQEHNSAGDILHTTEIRSVTTGWMPKSMGDTVEVMYAHLLHVGIIE
jgi:hypothetical protein